MNRTQVGVALVVIVVVLLALLSGGVNAPSPSLAGETDSTLPTDLPDTSDAPSSTADATATDDCAQSTETQTTDESDAETCPG